MDNENVEAVVEDILNRIAQSVIPDAEYPLPVTDWLVMDVQQIK